MCEGSIYWYPGLKSRSDTGFSNLIDLYSTGRSTDIKIKNNWKQVQTGTGLYGPVPALGYGLVHTILTGT